LPPRGVGVGDHITHESTISDGHKADTDLARHGQLPLTY